MREPTRAERELATREVSECVFDGHIEQAPSAQLVAIWQRARATWPSVALSAATFAAHLAQHVPPDATSDALAQINTADLYLACACAMGDPHALEAFEEHCLGGLDRALGRLRFSADVIAEVKQRVRCRALVADGGRPRIAEFGGRGALRAWVRVLGVREALRVTRRSHREAAVPDAERLQAIAMQDAGLDDMNRGYRRTFAQAFDRALRTLPARDRTLLRQHVLDGLTVDQLGALYRVHRATAARMLERARQRVLAATRASMRAELDVGSTELSSILRTIRSRLDITLRGLRRR
jgi:RNA polymerase sigma-70 factor (ECF subfamily)